MPVYNGVGAWWMPRRMRAAITAWFIRDFDESAAEDHDLAYWLGTASRMDIDRGFLASLLLQAQTARQRLKAYLIYMMVRLFGGPSYHAPGRVDRQAAQSDTDPI